MKRPFERAALQIKPLILLWLGRLDSNQDRQSQSLQCYRYTTPHHARDRSGPSLGGIGRQRGGRGFGSHI